jgi:hypothetical protein
VLRWKGRALSDLTVPLRRPQLNIRTDEDTIDLLRRLAVHYPDAKIAGIPEVHGLLRLPVTRGVLQRRLERIVQALQARAPEVLANAQRALARVLEAGGEAGSTRPSRSLTWPPRMIFGPRHDIWRIVAAATTRW